MRLSCGVVAGLGLSLSFGLSGAARAQAPFTDWESALKPGTTVVVGGVAQEFTSASGASGVISVSAPSTNMAATFTETFDPTGDINAMAVQNPNRSVGFYKANGDSIGFIANDRLIYGLSSDWTRKAIAADPLALDWKYQSFGVWVSGLGMAQGSMGAASVGAITPGTSVPQTGSASFTGVMGGLYNDAVGQDHIVAADMGLNVKFGAHNADFWTTNTKDKDGRPYSELDISGTFVSLPNHPALFGTLNTARLTGTSSAQFYGPAAEEVGGVFTMTPKSGSGLERLAGAFGGRRGSGGVGGAGGGNTGGGEPRAFSSWSDSFKPSASTVLSGQSVELTYNATESKMTSFSSPVMGAATIGISLDSSAAPKVASLAVTTPTRKVAFSSADGDNTEVDLHDQRAYAIPLLRSADGSRKGSLYSSYYWGFEVDLVQLDYLAFGVWADGFGKGAGSIGAFAGGAATPSGAVPKTGGGYFNGRAGGVYVDLDGTSHLVTSTVDAGFNFGTRTGFLTVYAGRDMETGVIQDRAYFAGNLTYDAARNIVTGDMLGGEMSGAATLRFFGPGAEEMGGLFVLGPRPGSLSREQFVGAYGGRRTSAP